MNSSEPVIAAPGLASHLATAGMASILLSLFGGAWMLIALNAESWMWVLACVLIPASLLVVRSIGLMMSAHEAWGNIVAGSERELQRAVGRRLLWLVLIVAGICVLAANLLASSGREDWILPLSAGIVAVQFLLWPKLLGDKFYYATGGIEILVCGVLTILMQHDIAAASSAYGLIMGLTLWLTVIFLLLRGRRVVGLLMQAAAEASAPQ